MAEQRFGIDNTSLQIYMKEGVTSYDKVNEICTLLQTSSTEGLPSFPANLALRQTTFGRNEYSSTSSSAPIHSSSYSELIKIAYEELQPGFIRTILVVLIFLAVINFALLTTINFALDVGDEEGDPKEFPFTSYIHILIPVSLLIVPIFCEAILLRRKQSRLTAAIQLLGDGEQTAQVMRGGELTCLKVKDIVVGDIVQLKTGDVVPADGLLLDANNSNISSNNLCITAGSSISKGTAEIVIIAVGRNTLLNLIATEPHQPKQKLRLKFILVLSITLGLTTFLTMLSKFSVHTYLVNKQSWDNRHLQKWFKFLGYGIDCALTVVPLTLPFVIVWTFHRSQENSKSLLGIYKFLQFKMTLDIVLGFIYFVKTVAISSAVLSGAQLTWINCFSNILAIILYPTDSYFDRPLKNTDQISTLSNETFKMIFAQVIWQLGMLFILLFCAEGFLDLEFPSKTTVIDNISELQLSPFNTMIFNCIAFMTLFHLFCVRMGGHDRNCFTGILHHPFFCIAWIITVILQMLITQFGGLAFSTYPLSLEEWLTCLCLSLTVFVWAQIIFLSYDKGEDGQFRRAMYEEEDPDDMEL